MCQFGIPTGHWGYMALLFDALFDTVGEGQGARPKRSLKGKVSSRRKLLKGKIQTSRASKGSETTELNWFDLAQLASQTPLPAVLTRPPSTPISLGSDFTGYGTDSLACHYLGVNYTVAFVAERSSVKDALRMALEEHVTHKKPMAKYSDVRARSTKDAPACDDLLASHLRPLGKGRGPQLPRDDSCFTVCSTLWTSFHGW